MKYDFVNAKSGEDASISIFPMNLKAVKEMGEDSLLEIALEPTVPIESLIAKAKIVSFCTDEDEDTIDEVFDPVTLTDCFSECLKLSGFLVQSLDPEKKTMNP